jgi:hypothetical protein
LFKPGLNILDAAGIQSVSEGLQMHQCSNSSSNDNNNNNISTSSDAAAPPAPLLPSTAATGAATSFYVDASAGSDTNDGSEGSPFRTVARGAAAAAASPSRPVGVILRKGTHYLNDTLELTSLHRETSFSGYPGEAAAISGGFPITGLSWKPASSVASAEASSASNSASSSSSSSSFVLPQGVMVADLPEGTPKVREQTERACVGGAVVRRDTQLA